MFSIKNRIIAAFLATPLASFACPDGQCENCALFVCGCVPDLACKILPKNPFVPIPPIIPVPDIIPQPPRITVTTIDQGIKDVTATVAKAFDDTVKTVIRAGADTSAEAGRVGRELETTGKAIVHYYENTANGTLDALAQGEQRLREGKVIDALWHAGLSPIQIEDKSASEAVLESDYLRGLGQVAANAYGGPQGAAAYSAWLAYHQSGGNASVALRVGLLTAATAFAFKGAQDIDGTTKKAIVTAAIGGIAVAAAGGDQQAIQEAFLKAGAMVVVQDGFRAVTNHDFDAKSSKGEAYCISADSTNCQPLPKDAIVGTDEKGNFIVDMKKVDPAVPAVGLKDHTAYFNEGNVVMTSVSRVPGMQAMAIFHDQWAIDWNMNALATPATIIPAIVLTYLGTGAPYYEELQKTAVEKALFKATPGNVPAPPLRADTPFAPFVIDSFMQLEGANLSNAVIYQQAPEGYSWCSGKNQFEITKKVTLNQMNVAIVKNFPVKAGGAKVITGKPAVIKPIGTTVMEITTCNKMSNWGTIQSSYPVSSSYACRVMKLEKGVWRTEVESLHDRDYCKASVMKVVNSSKGTGKWYRGDARR